MSPFWLIIISVVVGLYLTYRDNKSKLNTEFYKNLNISQLQNELLDVLDKILEKHDYNSNFIYVDFENFEALDKEITNYKIAIIDNDWSTIYKLSGEFRLKGRFQVLSEDNNWQEDFIVLNKKFINHFNAFKSYYESRN
ncbi:hypothetical protein [uncultured Psychroserpens sp.]|uniref:hypothetical protein n=1 Tax=uncultured Psychroserpens sp. TaxID=255436 RepID=UPI0026052B1A|nr:hypothetical protein [uncultured Psychroserpens sp.]